MTYTIFNTFRPYDFGTDAIERQRVSLGQSIIDADFEYGLQGTKWQSYQEVRKTPGFFEIPGTDLTVTNVISDGAAGQSLIEASVVPAPTQVGNFTSSTTMNQTISNNGGSTTVGNPVVGRVTIMLNVNTPHYITPGITFQVEIAGTSGGTGTLNGVHTATSLDSYNYTIAAPAGVTGTFTLSGTSKFLTAIGYIQSSSGNFVNNGQYVTGTAINNVIVGVVTLVGWGYHPYSGNYVGTLLYSNQTWLTPSIGGSSSFITTTGFNPQHQQGWEPNGHMTTSDIAQVLTNITTTISVSKTLSIQTNLLHNVASGLAMTVEISGMTPNGTLGTGILNGIFQAISTGQQTYQIDATVYGANGQFLTAGSTTRFLTHIGIPLSYPTGQVSNMDQYYRISNNTIYYIPAPALTSVTTSSNHNIPYGSQFNISFYNTGNGQLNNFGLFRATSTGVNTYTFTMPPNQGTTSVSGGQTFFNPMFTGVYSLNSGQSTYTINDLTLDTNFTLNQAHYIPSGTYFPITFVNCTRSSGPVESVLNGTYTARSTGTTSFVFRSINTQSSVFNVFNNSVHIFIPSPVTSLGKYISGPVSVVQTSPANYWTYYGAPALTISYNQQRWLTSTIPAFTPFVATSGATPGTPPYSANVISISGLLNITKTADRAEGFFPLLGVTTGNNLAFLAKGVIPAGQLSTSYTVIRRGGLFNNGNARIQGITSINQTASPNTVTVTTPVPHGLIPGTPIYAVGWLSSSEGVNGNYFLESVPNTTTFTYTPRQSAVQTGIVGGYIFVQTYSSTVHRPFDGGVLLAAGQPTYGSNIVRQSKKVFRYQSGKGLLWSSGTLFSPNNDIVSISSAGTAIGSLVSMVSEIANGLPQAGAKVEIVGVASTGFNTVGTSFYTINNVVESTTATTLSLNTISGLTPTTAAITSISGSGTTVTVNTPQPSSIASISGSGTTVTVNTSLAGIASINGSGSTVTVNTQSISISSITGNGTTVTVTTSSNHLLTAGVGVTISGTTNYNTTDLVVILSGGLTATVFTYASTVSAGTQTSAGTVTSPHGLSTGLIVTIAGTTNYNTTTAVVLTAPSTIQFTYASTATGGSSGGTVTSPHGLSPGATATLTGTTIFDTTTAIVSTAPSTTQFTYASTVTAGAPLYAFTNATFNGTTGRDGPSTATAQGIMTGVPAPSTWYSTFFTVTSGIQYWTVPATGTYNITAQGAQGGSTGYAGGRATRMQGDFTLIKNEIIAILVGQLGVSGNHNQGGQGTSGGGGTFVIRAPYNTLGSILAIAGGGGGSAQQNNSNQSGRSALTGTSGNTNNNSTGAGTGGYGGPYIGGQCGSGAGFFGDGSLPNQNLVGEQAKAFINGGTGGRRNAEYGGNEIYGGFGGGGGGPGLASGGGGGFSGGAEGIWSGQQAGGGGGSYNSGTNQVNQQDVFTGAGFATINLTSTRTTGIVSSPHGLSTGLAVAISGTTNYNTNGLPGGGVAITVTSPTQFTYASTSTGATSTGTVTTYRASLTEQPRFIMRQWHGSSVRAGCFEDQNGLFWEYDGQTLFVVKRSATFQLSGLVSCLFLGQTLTGDSNTRFLDQIRVGERFVMRGMTHTVTTITSQNTLTFNPPYRGTTEINTTVPARISKVDEIRVPQSQFNRDKLDGTGNSAFTVNLAKMQMIGLQYTWYGAGFVDFMMRGADGNWVYAHRFYNNNVNDEAYMRTGNMPVRYELVNESSAAISTLGAGLANAVTGSLTLTDDPTAFWPTAGTVQIDNELIAYTGKTSSTLTGLTRSASLVYNIADTNRTFTGSTTSGGDVHTTGATVNLVSTTCTPSLTHWGSALLMDGSFDTDRGYFFNYTFNQTTSISTNVQIPLFFIRLAPSASNGIVGDIGARDLLNRAQLLLQKLDCSVVGNQSTLNINGILNPVGFENSTFPWININTLGQGSQPSFTQFCNFSNVVTNGAIYASGSGERIFSLIAQGGSVSTIDLSALKELSNTVIGGSRMFPDGPDTLMIVATPLYNSITSAVLNLYWTEAQA